MKYTDMQIDSTTEAELKGILQYIINPRGYVMEMEQTINPTADDLKLYNERMRRRAFYIIEKLNNQTNTICKRKTNTI